MAEPPSGGRDASESATARFAGLLAVAVMLLTAPRLYFHELWRDEAWLYMVVGDSGSPAAMAANLARNGQGFFFPTLLLLAQAVWPSPRAMQLVNLVLTGCGAFAFARWAPFGRAERALAVLGYLGFYEYAVLSRHYAAGQFLLWLACAAALALVAAGGASPAAGRLALLGGALGLLCQTTVYGFILALAVLAGWLAGGAGGIAPRRLLPGAALFGAGALAGLFQLIPEPGTSFAPGWRFGWYPEILERVLQMPWRGIATWPRPGLHFWNSNLLDPWPVVEAGAGVALFAAFAWWLRKSRAGLVVWLVGGAGLAGFGYVKFVGVVRHDGHWWLLLAAALWLSGGLPQGRAGRLAFTLLLGANALVALYASWMDLRHPFSNAAAAAALIRERGYDRLPLLGYREPPAAPVALALGRPLFFPSRGIYARYPDWGPEMHEMEDPELRCAARAFAAAEGSDIVIVRNGLLPPWPEVEELAAITGAIQATEDYHLYRLNRALLAATAAEAACQGRN